MAATPVHQSSTSGTGTTTVVVNKPASTAQYDLLIAVLAADTASGTWPAQSGWTSIGAGSVPPSNQPVVAVFYKVAGASEPSSYTFNWGSPNSLSARISRITGGDTVNPIDSSVAASLASSTGATIGTITPTLTSNLIIEIIALAGSGPTITNVCTNVSSFTQQYADTGIGRPFYLATGTSTASGSATASYTLSSGAGTFAAAISVAPINQVTPSLFGISFGFFSISNIIKTLLPAAFGAAFGIFAATAAAVTSRWTNVSKHNSTFTNTPKS